MERELTTIFADAHHDGAIEKRALKASKQPHVVRLLSLALSRSLSLSPSRSLSVFLFPWPLGHVRSNADFPPDERRSSLFLLPSPLQHKRARPPAPQALLPFPDRRDLPFSLSCPLSESTPLELLWKEGSGEIERLRFRISVFSP